MILYNSKNKIGFKLCWFCACKMWRCYVLLSKSYYSFRSSILLILKGLLLSVFNPIGYFVLGMSKHLKQHETLHTHVLKDAECKSTWHPDDFFYSSPKMQIHDGHQNNYFLIFQLRIVFFALFRVYASVFRVRKCK